MRMEVETLKASGKKESGGLDENQNALFVSPFVTQEVKSVTKVKKKWEKEKTVPSEITTDQMEVIKWLVFLN